MHYLFAILKQCGRLQVILGTLVLFPAFISLITAEWYSCLGFLICSAAITLSGYLQNRYIKSHRELTYAHSMLLAAIGWMVIILLGSLPYYVIALITPESAAAKMLPAGADYSSSLFYFRDFVHCIFESTSAFTTTGLTMADHEPSVGYGVLFYRHFSQWIGGAGFIVLALAVFRQIPGRSSMLLYGSESSGERIEGTIRDTTRYIWKVYTLVTVIMIVYLYVGTRLILPDYPKAQAFFDALCHGLAGQSTGGFSTLDNSIADYHSAAMEQLYILPMVLGALSIPFFYRLIYLRRLAEFWKDLQTRSFFIAGIIGAALLSLLLIRSGAVESPVREGTFQFISALSTTGWQTSNIGSWDDVSVLFIIVCAMIVGGAAGATVGGIKIIRAVLLQKGLRWQLNKTFFPQHALKTVKFDGKLLSSAEMNKQLAQAGLFTLTYFLFLFVGTILTCIYLPEGYSLSDAIFETASAQGTVGLSSGISGPSMPRVLEVTYIFQMWSGRLEIIPVLMLIRVLWRGTKPVII